MQKVEIEERGGTMVLALPADIVEELNLRAGTQVDLAVQDGALLVQRKRRSRYTLDELMDRSDPRAFERTEEDKEWFDSPPVGRELI